MDWMNDSLYSSFAKQAELAHESATLARAAVASLEDDIAFLRDDEDNCSQLLRLSTTQKDKDKAAKMTKRLETVKQNIQQKTEEIAAAKEFAATADVGVTHADAALEAAGKILSTGASGQEFTLVKGKGSPTTVQTEALATAITPSATKANKRVARIPKATTATPAPATTSTSRPSTGRTNRSKKTSTPLDALPPPDDDASSRDSREMDDDSSIEEDPYAADVDLTGTEIGFRLFDTAIHPAQLEHVQYETVSLDDLLDEQNNFRPRWRTTLLYPTIRRQLVSLVSLLDVEGTPASAQLLALFDRLVAENALHLSFMDSATKNKFAVFSASRLLKKLVQCRQVALTGRDADRVFQFLFPSSDILTAIRAATAASPFYAAVGRPSSSPPAPDPHYLLGRGDGQVQVPTAGRHPSPAHPKRQSLWDAATPFMSAGLAPSFEREALLEERQRNPPPHHVSPHWEHITYPSPDELTIDGDTQRFPYWLAYCPAASTSEPVAIFPIPYHIPLMDRQMAMAALRDHSRLASAESLAKIAKANSMPVYHPPPAPVTPASVEASLIQWYNSLVLFGQAHGFFVPPLHTMIVDVHLGAWRRHLDVHQHGHTETIWQSHLLMYLQNPKTGLNTDKAPARVKNCVATATNGYHALYLLGTEANSRMRERPTPLDIPRQKESQSVSDYLTDWITYSAKKLLCLTIFSDRGFVDGFVAGLLPTYHERYGLHLLHRLRFESWDRPLPPKFNPTSLLNTMRDIIGEPHGSDALYTALRPPAPSRSLALPPSLTRSGRPFSPQATHQVSFAADDLLDSADEAALVAALESTGLYTVHALDRDRPLAPCQWCLEDHLASAICPLVARLGSGCSSASIAALIRKLDAHHRSVSRPSAAPSATPAPSDFR
ncbi:hypothetical protein MPSEU_000523500 [Mayamaea pseudoterrestris]|nr:hypothetical protein MPSEU_000523500 [Mayamaea pseudoterrestris]